MTFIKLYLIIQYENKGRELHPRQHPNIFHGKLGSRYRKPTSTTVRTKQSVSIFVLSHYYKTGFIISYLVSSSLFSRYELKAMDLDVNDTFLFHADRFVVYLYMWQKKNPFIIFFSRFKLLHFAKNDFFPHDLLRS